MTDNLTYDEFSSAADSLYFNEVIMPSAKRTYEILKHGSLATHQRYLERWQNDRKQKPLSIPDHLGKIIGQKGKDYAETIWQSLRKANEQENNQIKQEAEHIVSESKEALHLAQLEREAALKEISQLHEQLILVKKEIEEYRTKLTETEKLHYAAEEANKTLSQQLNDLKEGTQKQISYLTELNNKHQQTETDLRKQIKSNEEVHQRLIIDIKEEHKKELDQLKHNMNDLHHDNKQLEEKLSLAQQENLKITTYFEKMKENSNNLQDQLDSKMTENKEQQSQIQQRNILLARKEVELIQANKQHDANKDKVFALENEIKGLMLKMGKLEEKLAVKIDEIKSEAIKV